MKHLLTIGIMFAGLVGIFGFLAILAWVMRHWWEPFERKHWGKKWFVICGEVKNAVEAVLVWGLLALIVLSVYASIYSEL